MSPFEIPHIDWDIPLRFLGALGAGLVLGLERESHGRAAGVRTTVLVCLAATGAMALSGVFYASSFDPVRGSATWHPDPARLAAGILSGIGFIGGGVIITQGNLVRGVTTAAVLWVVTVIGLCFGAGHFLLGCITTGLSYLTLMAVPSIEKLVPNDWYVTMTVKTIGEAVSLDEISAILREHGIRIKSVDWHYDIPADTRAMKLALKFKKRDLVNLPEKIVAQIARRPNVTEIRWT